MSETQPLYRRLLGDDYDRLPQPIRSMHDIGQRLEAHGVADIRRGNNPISRLIASILRFPAEGRGVPVHIALERDGEREIWRRDFAGSKLTTIQEPGTGRADGLLVERFGPIAFLIRLVATGDELRLEPVTARFLGCPLPRWLLPIANAYEQTVGGRFVFDVDIALPVLGPLIHYRGHLAPGESASPRPSGPSVTRDYPGPVMLFDGVCNLCCGAARFILEHDTGGRIRFCAMQSTAGQALLETCGLPGDSFETFLVLDDGRSLVRSTAFFHLVQYLPFPWPIIRVGLIVPCSVRDWLYNLIARNRYRLFGRRTVCFTPSPAQASRFI